MGDRNVFEKALGQSLDELGYPVEGRHIDLMWRHFELLVEANRRFNLTRITAPADAAVKHYADALALLVWAERRRAGFEFAASRRPLVLDVGAGGGFPAAPVAIVRPDWVVVALDKTAKKVRFVQRCAEALGLANLTAVHGRLPLWKPELCFDLVVFRAVAAVGESLRVAAQVVARGGWLVCYKTASTAPAELEQARRWAQGHAWQTQAPFEYALHEAERRAPRRLIAFRRAGD